MAKEIKQKAYILRLWQAQNQTHYTLINPHTGWRRSFPNLQTFAVFLSDNNLQNTTPSVSYHPPDSLSDDNKNTPR